MRGDTERSPIRIGDEHHLEILPVIRPQQPFPRSVGRDLRLDYLGPRNREALREPAMLRLGNVGHRREVGNPAIVDPVPDLLGPKLRGLGLKACALKLTPNLVLGQSHEFRTPIGPHARCAGDRNRINVAGNLHGRAYSAAQHAFPPKESAPPRTAQRRGIDRSRRALEDIDVDKGCPIRGGA